MSKKRIIVFVKNAVAGKVKTRLAKTIGDEEALNVYLQLLNITKKEVKKVSFTEKEVWYAWSVAENDLWDDLAFKKRVQIDGDLGEKMKDAFQKSFQEEKEKIVLIGSDCPTLTSEILEKAFEELSTHDAVFGPSKDGGYYLIGMKGFHPELLEGIAWSTEEVLNQTKQQAEKNEISIALLPVLNDIDNEDDWNQYLNSRA